MALFIERRNPVLARYLATSREASIRLLKAIDHRSDLLTKSPFFLCSPSRDLSAPTMVGAYVMEDGEFQAKAALGEGRICGDRDQFRAFDSRLSAGRANGCGLQALGLNAEAVYEFVDQNWGQSAWLRDRVIALTPEGCNTSFDPDYFNVISTDRAPLEGFRRHLFGRSALTTPEISALANLVYNRNIAIAVQTGSWEKEYKESTFRDGSVNILLYPSHFVRILRK